MCVGGGGGGGGGGRSSKTLPGETTVKKYFASLLKMGLF